MKRWFTAVAILLFGAASFSSADYVLIRAILGGAQGDPNHPSASGGPTAPGAPGSPRGPGGPGAPPPPGGGGPRGPGGGPSAPMPPGGDPTLGTLNQLGAGQTIDTAALAVQAVVHVKHKSGQPLSYVSHKWSQAPNGTTRLFNDGSSLISVILPIQSLHARFEAKKLSANRGGKEKQLEAAEWALEHGLNDDFAALMDGFVAQKEHENSANSQAFRDAVKAYMEVKAALEKPIDNETRANYWSGRLNARMEKSKHYAVVYTSGVNNPPEVQSRLAALENHMRSFYYWFALKGRALPMPKDKLVAVMLNDPKEFRRQRAVLEDEPLVTDGFFSHRDNICVFSSQRIDGPWEVFERQVSPLWSGGAYDRSALLEGTARRKIAGPYATEAGQFARMMTLALLERALEEEAERAAVTHEGTRQLMVATNLIPRTVIPPNWAEFGTAAAFETPKGPFPEAPIGAAVAIYPGVMGPSWAYLRWFKKHVDADQKGTQAAFLKDVITDRFFNRVIATTSPQGGVSHNQESLLRARSSAWALGYYLMKFRLPGMIRYFQELSAMPRDLELDDKALLACFARAFDVANATRDGIDPAKFEQLAKDWISAVKGLPTPGAEFGLGDETNGTNPQGGPARPGVPGTGGGPRGGTPRGGPGG